MQKRIYIFYAFFPKKQHLPVESFHYYVSWEKTS